MPGLNLWGFFTPRVAGADLRGGDLPVASCARATCDGCVGAGPGAQMRDAQGVPRLKGRACPFLVARMRDDVMPTVPSGRNTQPTAPQRFCTLARCSGF